MRDQSNTMSREVLETFTGFCPGSKVCDLRGQTDIHLVVGSKGRFDFVSVQDKVNDPVKEKGH